MVRDNENLANLPEFKTETDFFLGHPNEDANVSKACSNFSQCNIS